MQVTITPRNVMTIVIEVDRMLIQRQFGFNQAEVLIGLQELVGRIIVEMSNTQVGADELINHAKGHLDNTVRIGMQQKNQPQPMQS